MDFSDEYYDSDDALPKSPGLAPVTVDYGPSLLPNPTGWWLPSDVSHVPFGWTDATEFQPHNGAESHPLDSLLVFNMDPNLPYIAPIFDEIRSSKDLDIILPKNPSQHHGLSTTTTPHVSRTLTWSPQMQSSYMERKPESLRRISKTRLGLPLTLNVADGPATVMACADTGSEENIISADLVAALRLPIHLESKQQFVLASGKVVQAIGQVTAPCGFGVDTSPLPTLLRCVFHVFVKLATPIIMGMAFLEETETMTKHRHRLVRVPRPAIQALQVYSLGRPRKNLVCYIDGKQALAVPDSGSDIDLMTPRFAIENGLQISHGEEMLEFADGTVAVTSGSVQVELAVNNFESSITRIPAVNFYLLDNFIHDVLIGADSVEELEVFTKNQHALVATSDSSGPLGLNRIRHLGALDRIVSWVKGKISKMQNRNLSTDATSNDTMENTLNDQYENDRRERETLRIAHLPLDEQESAMDAEARRQAEYNRRRTQPSSPSSSEGLSASSQPFSSQDDTNLLGIGTELASRDLTLPIIPLDQMYSIGYRCEHPGCTAAPFQTQYLLNSHMNVHSQIRPHYCPVKGCPRGEGGKGFKRKNEMIRHQLVHESPGYVCPFCPDREHKYPRPENLQRHVRVHHIDKDKDDPQLREVLAQRPEGGSRGRRRRT